MKVPGIPYVQGRNDYPDRDGKKYGMAIHNTSNDASDTGEASYATRRTDGIGSHFYVDADSITQSIDTNDRVGHAGSYEGNEHAIAFELTGGNAKTRQWWIENIAWDKLAKVIAYMLKNDPDLRGFEIRRASVAEMKANPKIKAFYGHDDMRRAWGGTTHTDPGPNFPWDHLIASVKKAMVPPTIKEEVKEIVDLFTQNAILYTDGRVEAMANGRDTVRSDLKGGGGQVWIVQALKDIQNRLSAIEAKLNTTDTSA